ncbi:MAG: hypothetical protein EAZ53_07010 [Bacteroidetes bacterium]|nr:MAG: hypothetical protein EAZ53_07010 [Bacteroidota bacterium]
MTDDEKIRDFLKEDLKSNYEYIRTYSLFILGLCTSEGTLLLRNDLLSNQIVLGLVTINTFTLTIISIFMVKTFIDVSNLKEKLKIL